MKRKNVRQYTWRRALYRMLDGLLSVAVLLGAAGLLVVVLALEKEEGTPAPAGQDQTVYTHRQEPPSAVDTQKPVPPVSAPAEPPSAADTQEPVPPASTPAEPPSVADTQEPVPPALAPAEPVPGDSWELILVNRWNPLPEDYSVQTVELSNGLRVDERCWFDLQAMLDACRAEGLSPVICSAYRSREKQEELFSRRVDRLMDQGCSRDRAEEEAGKLVAVPGTSEHQTGLALDIVDLSNQLLDESQEDTAVQKWLMAHSWEYGFILRYPPEKSELTGISYEPWHYRYVGRENARQIYSMSVCLEEYLGQSDHV